MMGLVGIWDAIGFYEVADLQKMSKEVVTTLKTYCESGTFPSTASRSLRLVLCSPEFASF